MAAEDEGLIREDDLRSWEEAPERHSFDELAQGLASGTITRVRALKLMGPALFGVGLLSLLLPDVAGARKGRRRRCLGINRRPCVVEGRRRCCIFEPVRCVSTDPSTYPGGLIGACCMTPVGSTSGMLTQPAACQNPPPGFVCTCRQTAT